MAQRKKNEFDKLVESVMADIESERKSKADAVDVARVNHELFEAFVEAGFRREEAVFLVAKMMEAAVRGGQ